MNDSGCDKSEPSLLSYEQAIEQMLAAATPLHDSEQAGLEQALGRILHTPVYSAIDVPSWDNSAMDGYALSSGDLGVPGIVLPVSQRIPAGVPGTTLEPGTAARIFTGAPVPRGADMVVMQEDCTDTAAGVKINAQPSPGANVRRRGEDIAQGGQILASGALLGAQHLGLAASVGVARLEVFRRLRVALLTSGDELVMPGQPLGPGQIYNSNLFTAAGLLRTLGCEVVETRMVKDTLDETVQSLRRAAANADLILATGGVSVGEEDHVKPAVEMLGSLDLWKIAVRPGKPLAFGRIEGTPVIGTPGNPVSVFVTFLLFALPFIRRLQGRTEWTVEAVRAIADFDWKRPGSRREFARARLRVDPAGEMHVTLHPSRSSGVLSSVTWADGLAIIAEGQTVRAGEAVRFLEFKRLLSG